MTAEKRDIEMHENDLFDAKQLDLSQGVETFQDVMENNPPNQLGWGYIRLYALCGIIYLCSTMNGFDGSLISSINANAGLFGLLSFATRRRRNRADLQHL